jgi:HYR domain
VQDTTPPTIVCSTNLILECNSPAGAIGMFVVTTSDLCDPSPVITSSPSSGSVFPPGVTTVTNVALDASGNSNVCTFTVTVKDTPAALSITLSNADVIISWPTPCVAGVLEETGSLNPPILWSPVVAPVVIVGPLSQVTLPATGQPRYFRLRQ